MLIFSDMIVEELVQGNLCDTIEKKKNVQQLKRWKLLNFLQLSQKKNKDTKLVEDQFLLSMHIQKSKLGIILNSGFPNNFTSETLEYLVLVVTLEFTIPL